MFYFKIKLYICIEQNLKTYMEDLLRRKEVLELLNITSKTLWDWENAGKVKRVLVGKRIYYKKSELFKEV